MEIRCRDSLQCKVAICASVRSAGPNRDLEGLPEHHGRLRDEVTLRSVNSLVVQPRVGSTIPSLPLSSLYQLVVLRCGSPGCRWGVWVVDGVCVPKNKARLHSNRTFLGVIVPP